MRLPEILEKRFEEYKKDIPNMIQISDEYYGSYIMRPVIFICFDYYYEGMSREEFRKIQRLMMDANSEFRELIYGYNLKSLNDEKGKDTFVIYVPDFKDNKGWSERNPYCGYMRYVKSYKGNIPIGVNSEKILKDYWEKYPFTRIKE